MPLKRSQYQSDKSLEEFYIAAEWEGALRLISEEMRRFVDVVNEHFVETTLTASTSIQRLCIQDKDDEVSNWVVIVSNYGVGQYHFEYKVPRDKSPWDGAWMKGTANDLEEALIYLIKSMNESGFWEGNKELLELRRKYDVH